MHNVEAKLQPGELLALVAYKEQFLLYLDRPTVNFGHRRWLEGEQEGYDASAWLAGAPGRVLMVPKTSLKPCFVESANRQAVGSSAGDDWYLVRGTADAGCAIQGKRQPRYKLRSARWRPRWRVLNRWRFQPWFMRSELVLSTSNGVSSCP